MKKILVSLLSLCISGFASADTTTLYGSIGYNVNVVKKENTNNNLKTDELYFGIKGDEVINPNLSAIYKLEFNGSDSRYAYVGLDHKNFGKITLGTQDSLFYNTQSYTDIFEDSFINDNTVWNKDFQRVSNSVRYTSPKFKGIELSAQGIIGQDVKFNEIDYKLKDNKFISLYELGATLDYNNYYVGLGYVSAEKSLNSGFGKSELIGTTLGYKNNNFKVGLSNQHLSSNGDKTTLVGEYYVGPNTFRAGFNISNEDKKENNVYSYGLGYKYNLSKRTYTYIEGTYTDYNSKLTNDKDLKIGLRHSF